MLKRGLLAWLAMVSVVLASPRLFSEDFDQKSKSFGDTIYYKLRPDTFGIAAAMTSSDSTKGAMVASSLDVAPLLGKRLLLSAWTSAHQLSQRPQPWNGVKVMLIVVQNDGRTSYPQLAWPVDSQWSWRRSALPISIPLDTRSVQILFGLEKTGGSVRFDSLQLTFLTQAFVPARDSNLPIPDYAPTRLRGAQISSGPGTAAVARFGASWKANLLRWQFWGDTSDNPLSSLSDRKYDSLLQAHIANLDTYLPTCKANGIKIVLCMHNLSRGLFDGPAPQARLLQTWKRLATRYRDSSQIWAYDLANEPDVDAWREGVLNWNDLADTLARTIRAVDAQKVIVVESPVGDVSTFPALRPVGATRNWDLDRIVYSFHYYHPFTLTHQGIPGHPPMGTQYPGTIDGEAWNAAKIRQDLAPALEFQKRYRVPMYVGEFSCVRWATNHSSLRWFADVLPLFEEFGWDWTYHAYQEYEGWSLEYSDSLGDLRTPLETDRKALMMSYFASNKNPYAPVTGNLAKPNSVGLFWRRTATGLQIGGVPAGARARLFHLDGREISPQGSPVSFPVQGRQLLLLQLLPQNSRQASELYRITTW